MCLIAFALMCESFFFRRIYVERRKTQENIMKEKVILRSAHPEEYPDLEIECLVIPNDQIGEYLDSIRGETEEVVAYKSGSVIARSGVEGEKVDTILKTIVDGKEYILGEESNTVKKRTCADGEERCDIVVANTSSTSNERYVVKYDKFIKTYELDSTLSHGCMMPAYRYIPVPEERVLTMVPENVIIMTSWGEPAVCLAGSYIVTYNADANDYNTIEKGAFESTYTVTSFGRKRK